MKTGTTAGFEARMMKFDEFNCLVALEEIQKKEDAYINPCSGP